MAARRPFAHVDAVHAAADDLWAALDETGWLQAFAHHPRIGERNLEQAKYQSTSNWSKKEQSGMAAASDDQRRELVELGTRYEQRFGYVFLICATGRTAGEMLAELRRRLAKAFRYADLDGDERIASYFHWIAPDQLEAVLSSNLRQSAASASRGPVLEALDRLPDSVPPLNRMLYLEGKFFLADHNLNYVDKVSMASGVEVRVPLLDPDLMRLAARLPLDLKQRGRTGKWVLRRAMESYLPRSVIHRGKTGFGAPLRNWLRDDLRPLVDDVLPDRAIASRGLLDPAGVRELIEGDRNRRYDASYTIFSMICIELWCRMFVDQPTPGTI